MNQYEIHRPKKTFYNGRWYKSNREAKVAECLDSHGAIWEYEPCCFRDARFEYGQYTPDFRILTNSGKTLCYVEVCGKYDEYHRRKCSTLARIIEEGQLSGYVIVVSSTLFGAIVSIDGIVNAYKVPDQRVSFLSEVLHVQQRS